MSETRTRGDAPATGALLVGAGLLWLAEAAGWVDLDARTWVGLLLVGIGTVLVLDRRAPHGLLALAGIALAVLAIPLATFDLDVVAGGVGERREAPTTIEEPLRLGVGKLVVDLGSVELDDGTQRFEASVGVGELVVLVPRDVGVRIDGRAGVGEVDLLGERESGLGVELESERTAPDAPVLELEVAVAIGSVAVERR